MNALASSSFPQEEEGMDVGKIGQEIVHHVLDDYVWTFYEGSYGTIYLPIIVYSSSRGLDVFSSARFYDENHKHVAYDGYELKNHHIVFSDSKKEVLDLSITKNVTLLFLLALLLVIILRYVAVSYARNKGRAPKGLQSVIEPVVVFVTNEIIKPNAGPNYRRYTPYLLTLFFFILLGNILGLLPGGANLTGNIAVTMVLAVCTFIITNVNGNRQYWSHIFWTPSVPFLLRFILLPVELIGLITKPFALMIRLFVAITAGHIVMLSLLYLSFIFQSYTVGIVTSVFLVLINLIELLVAAIQAYVFTLFSALYIGLATVKDDH